jgi:hypothetical protein
MARIPRPLAGRSLHAPVLWGVIFGVIQAGAPLGFWWLAPATVYALSLVLIAAVYIGFAVADGRARVIAVEVGIAAAFVVVAAAGVTGPAWLLVVGLAGHGAKDLWQHRRQFVANTLVAAVLPGRGLGRRRHPGGAARRRRRLPPLEPTRRRGRLPFLPGRYPGGTVLTSGRSLSSGGS